MNEIKLFPKSVIIIIITVLIAVGFTANEFSKGSTSTEINHYSNNLVEKILDGRLGSGLVR